MSILSNHVDFPRGFRVPILQVFYCGCLGMHFKDDMAKSLFSTLPGAKEAEKRALRVGSPRQLLWESGAKCCIGHHVICTLHGSVEEEETLQPLLGNRETVLVNIPCRYAGAIGERPGPTCPNSQRAALDWTIFLPVTITPPLRCSLLKQAAFPRNVLQPNPWVKARLAKAIGKVFLAPSKGWELPSRIHPRVELSSPGGREANRTASPAPPGWFPCISRRGFQNDTSAAYQASNGQCPTHSTPWMLTSLLLWWCRDISYLSCFSSPWENMISLPSPHPQTEKGPLHPFVFCFNLDLSFPFFVSSTQACNVILL